MSAAAIRLPASCALLIALLWTLVMTACVTPGDAGEAAPDWLALESAPTHDGCPDLAGLYENRPSAAYPGSVVEAPALTDVFRAMAMGPAVHQSGHRWSIPSEASRIRIEQEPGSLTLIFFDEDGESTTKSFRRLRIFRRDPRMDELFSCKVSHGRPRLGFPLAPAMHQSDSAAPIYVGGSDVSVYLFRATDGALIVELVTERVGLSAVIVGTHYTRSSTWSRYAPTGGDD